MLCVLNSGVVAFHLRPRTRSSRAQPRLAGRRYIPDGLSPEEWKRIQEKDKKSRNSIGGLNGPRGYKSRSMSDFVKALEDGSAKHLMPVDPRKVSSGEIKMKDVPYMQRPGGTWDNSDLKVSTKVTNLLEKFLGPRRRQDSKPAPAPLRTDEQMWKDAGAISIKDAKNQKADKIDSPKTNRKWFGWK